MNRKLYKPSRGRAAWRAIVGGLLILGCGCDQPTPNELRSEPVAISRRTSWIKLRGSVSAEPATIPAACMEACTDDGACALVNNECVPRDAEDCEASANCELLGRCSLSIDAPFRCVTTPTDCQLLGLELGKGGLIVDEECRDAPLPRPAVEARREALGL